MPIPGLSNVLNSILNSTKGYSSRSSRSRDEERGSRDNWEDDDDYRSRKNRSWDTPTPSRSVAGTPYRSERSGRNEPVTPLATPTYKYNEWDKNGKKMDYKGAED